MRTLLVLDWFCHSLSKTSKLAMWLPARSQTQALFTVSERHFQRTAHAPSKCELLSRSSILTYVY